MTLVQKEVKKVYLGTHQVRPIGVEYTVTNSTLLNSYSPSYSDIQGCFLSPDGVKLYMSFWSSQTVVQYSLSSAYDLTTAVQVRTLSVTQPNGLWFTSDGTKFLIIREGTGAILRYSLSTARDISTATQDKSLVKGTSGYPNRLWSARFNNDGTILYYVKESDGVHQCTLSTAYDIETVTTDTVPYSFGAVKGISFAQNGKYVITSGDGSSVVVIQYELSTPRDLSSVLSTTIGSFLIYNGDGRGLWCSEDLHYWIEPMGTYGNSLNLYEATVIN